MRGTCTGLWEKEVSKIPTNLFGNNDDYTKCTYVGFSEWIKKWEEKRFEIAYRLTTKKDFIADTFDDVFFQYPIIKKFKNIEQICESDTCELRIRSATDYTLMKVIISKADNEDFKDWLTVN